MAPAITHSTQMLARVIAQYADATKLRAVIQSLGVLCQDVEDVLQDMTSLFDLETVTGVQLDRIGAWVGLHRLSSTASWTDDEYRAALRLKVLQNISRGTSPEIVDALAQYFDTSVLFVDFGAMSIGFGIPREPTAAEVVATNAGLLPKPMGVLYATKVSYIPDGFFGFDDQEGALGFDAEEPGDQPGGVLAEDF